MIHRTLLAVATTFVFLLSLPLAAQVQKKEVAGIRNYSRVDATVGCGGATDPAAMKALKAEGYVSVINLRLANEPGIDTVTPAVISRVKGRSPDLRLRVSAPITGGHKLVARRGSSAQEVFLITSLSADQLETLIHEQLT